jgi:molybdenum cofactor synthesis domain-containing protein
MKRTAAVITVSDGCSQGLREDTSGPALEQLLTQAGYEIIHTQIVPDDYEEIRKALLHCADTLQVCLVLTTGGTGFSPRDITPEATLSILEREARGIPEAMRQESLRITPRACLSREVAGLRGGTLIVNLPGSKKASTENLSAVLPSLAHGIDILRGWDSNCGAEHHHEEGHHHG